jgi:hypothetical protein
LGLAASNRPKELSIAKLELLLTTDKTSNNKNLGEIRPLSPTRYIYCSFVIFRKKFPPSRPSPITEQKLVNGVEVEFY